ncbi:testis-expressed protein 10 homolog isoform X1 [Dreissena polymorpha]|uniref:testis-expressed protein 10 homolog isoform X1 n=1 Tax=Dreissena polymorpha TaxID=45954 RepID=UPI002264660E|nr:testis-expressed protein 10 homolog isoform X1 [Dreissena polymorpha]
MAKSKKKKNADFQKVKLKVGKKLKKADNVTNASFKSRSIQISQHLKTGDSTQPVTKKKHNIAELFSHCRHYSPSVRHEAVTGLKELLSENPQLIDGHLPDIIEKSAEMFSDKDSTVRRGAVKHLLKLVFPVISEKQIAPFFPLVSAHLCCAMTHINDDIKMDSLAVLDLLLDHFPKLMVTKSSQVLTNFIEQISRQQGQGQSRSLTINPSSGTSSMKWRLLVMSRLQKFLKAVLVFHGENKDVASEGECDVNKTLDFLDSKVNCVQAFSQSYHALWTSPGYLLSSMASKVPDSSSSLDSDISKAVQTLIPLMLECWVEATPGSDKPGQSGKHRGQACDSTSAGMLYHILCVTRLLWECVHRGQKPDHQVFQTPEGLVSMFKYQREFETHFLSKFPYMVNNAVTSGKKETNKDLILEKVSGVTLNLTVCDIMTNFLQPHSHQVLDWLPLVIRYMMRVLSKDGSQKGGKHNASLVVKIVRRLCLTNISDEEVSSLVNVLYHRYQQASPTSAEKTVFFGFFADCILKEGNAVLSLEVANSFLSSLAELLPLCVQDNPGMASLILHTLRMACVQNCSQFMVEPDFLKIFCSFFEPDHGVISHLPPLDQRQLIGLLYFLPRLQSQLLKMLTSLCRHSKLNEQEVTFLIQVLQNRYIKHGETSQEAILYVGFLANILTGMPQKDLVEQTGRDPGSHVRTGLQPVPLVYPAVKEGQKPYDWHRHFTLVKVVSTMMSQCTNSVEVFQVIVTVVEKLMTTNGCIPLQAVYGLCKMAESFSVPPACTPILKNACISLVTYMFTCEELANPNVAEVILNTGCNLLCQMENGVEDMFRLLLNTYNTGASVEEVLAILKVCVKFLTMKRSHLVQCNPETVQLMMELQRVMRSKAMSNVEESVSSESEKLMTQFEYHLSL